MNFPDKKYSVIYADPPWRYQDKSCKGGAAKHYDTMQLQDICSLPVKDLAADNCVLFMWATYPMIKEALEVIEAWGFKYKSIAFQWVKQNPSGNGYFFGLGRWTRGNTEPCLIAVKGKPKRASASVSQLIISPIRAHSRKPDVTRDKIQELMGGGAVLYRTVCPQPHARLGRVGGTRLINMIEESAAVTNELTREDLPFWSPQRCRPV